MNHLDIERAIDTNVITLEEGLALDDWLFQHQEDETDVRVPDSLYHIIEKILKMKAN